MSSAATGRGKISVVSLGLWLWDEKLTVKVLPGQC